MKNYIALLLILLPFYAMADWAFNFTRRNKDIRKKEYTSSSQVKDKGGFFDFVLNSSDPINEIVILNTDHGFVPSTINAKEGMQYRIHIVNVNEKDKNVSFVLDAFSEHHATYFGKIKSFIINPQKEGIYTFQSPETSAQGRLVVYPTSKVKESSEKVNLRAPASE
ncbi:MAG: cupredoxin domain-containing protein [Bdellovibrionaceae bacterium]|nr:cupredoxin domain-containing protein [Pseudobdellovibrionaceae bacterium]